MSIVNVEKVAVLGAGVIGSSWAALFLAAGKQVSIYDPMPGAEQSVKAYIHRAWPTMEALDMTSKGNPDAISFHNNAVDAVKGAQFIQENVPEQIAIKHALFAEIEDHLEPDVDKAVWAGPGLR